MKRIWQYVWLLFLIVVLLLVLLPALAGNSRPAHIVQTQALMVGLRTNIEAYYCTFGAYPGPVPRVQPLSGNATCTTGIAGVDKISGTQNLLLGLTYGMKVTSGGTQIVGTSATPLYVDATLPEGPMDLATSGGKHYAAFYNPVAKELGADNANVGWTAFPTIVDRFADALPILYYRRLPRVETQMTSKTTTNEAYSLVDNAEYTSATALVSSSGRIYNQTTGVFGPNEFNALVSQQGSAVVGEFVLISAGKDRIYGMRGGRSDDIVVVGGQ